MDLHGEVAAALERSVAPSVIARGGSLRVLAVEDGMVTLEASGSPGATLPLVPRIEALIRAAVHGITSVRVVHPGEAWEGASGGDLNERVHRVLDGEINPTIAAHRGHVDLVGVDQGLVRIRLDGGCQGCS